MRRGGKRPGAGRPALIKGEKRVMVAVSLSPRLVLALRHKATGERRSLSSVFEEVLSEGMGLNHDYAKRIAHEAQSRKMASSILQ